MKTQLCFLMALTSFLTVFSADLAFVKNPPVIDGSGKDPVWQALAWNSGFTTYKTHRKPQAETRFKIAYDRENLYCLIEAFEPSMKNLSLRKITTRIAEDFWMSDSVEILMVHDVALQFYHKILIDSAGRIQEIFFGDDNTGRAVYTPFHLWRSFAAVKTSRTAGSWIVECSIPLASLDPGKNPKWRFNINRNRHAGKQMEVTSWVKVNGSSHPAAYREFSLPEFKADSYQFFVDNISGKTGLDSSKKIVHEVLADLINKTGNFRIARARYELLDSEFRSHASGEKLVDLQDGKFARVKIPLKNIRNGKYFLSFSYRSLAGDLLKTVLKPVVIQYQPVAVRMIRPAYRNNLYATMPDKTIEAEISLDGVKSSTVKVSLKDQKGKTLFERTIPGNALPAKVTFPGDKLAEGNYFLEASAGKAHRKSVRIRKLPFHAGEVWLDDKGITHVEGKRFLPYGWFIFRASDPKGKAFNSQLNYGIGARSVENFHKNLTSYSNAGLKSIVFPYQEFTGKHDWKIFAHSTRTGSLRPEQKKHLEKYIPLMKNHPSLLGWYFADEPESRGGNNPQWFVQAHELMQELDPYHPNLMLNWGIQGMLQFHEGCDILIPDCYIRYMADGSTKKPRWATSDWMKAATSLGKTAWLVPQAFIWGTASPTFNDYRSEIYQALIHNCKGFQLYNYQESKLSTDLTLAPDAVGSELMQIKDLVLENTIPGAVKVKTPPGAEHFQSGLKYWKGEYILIAVNTSLKSFDAEFTLNRNLPGNQLHVLGEKRAVVLKNGSFKDHFGPAETHVYLTSAKRAASVEDLAAVRGRIATMKKARKMPGNKAAIGEIANIYVYRDFIAGKRPAHIPAIKGSSDYGSWFTTHYYRINSFYFLLDGVKDHSSDFMIWGPASGDRNPWIEIEFSTEQSISEVRLFTLLSGKGVPGISGAGVSWYDGKAFRQIQAPSQRRGNQIAIRFPAVKTKRIRVDRFQFTPGQSRRSLTEIEVY